MIGAIQITVYGRPQPAGSKKAFSHPHTGRTVVVDDAKKSMPWKQQVAGAARAAYDGPLMDGPLVLHVNFYMSRPRSHFGTGRRAEQVRATAPTYPTVKPDATKMVRAVEDALTGIVWRDDACVVHQVVWKLYGEPERVELKVRRLGDITP